MTVEEIRKKLKLEPAAAYRSRLQRFAGADSLFKNLPMTSLRRTGRTTELLVPALARLSEGATLYLEAADRAVGATKSFVLYAQHLAYKCGLDWKRILAGAPPTSTDSTVEVVWLADHPAD